MTLDGKKTIIATVLIVIYIAGLLRNWWPRSIEVESFLFAFFSAGAGHKVVKYRRRRKEVEIANQDNPYSDDPRIYDRDKPKKYDSVGDLLDRED